MSEFDDEIRDFLGDAAQMEARFAADSVLQETNETLWATELAQVLTDQGFTTISEPGSEDAYPRVSILSTPRSTQSLTDKANLAWTTFSDYLLLSKSFLEYGGSDSDYIDPEALETATEALEAVLADTDISVEDLQAARNVSRVFLGHQVTQSALEILLVEPVEDLSTDTLLDMKRTLAQASVDNRGEQFGHNRDITKDVRPWTQHVVSDLLPFEHDDFSGLVQTVEILAKLQCNPQYVEIVEAQDGLTQALVDSLLKLSGRAIDRHGLDVDYLLAVSGAVAGIYKAAGYVSEV